MRQVDLPIVICGRVIEPSGDTESYRLNFNELEVRLPVPDSKMLDSLSKTDRNTIRNCSTHEIVDFLSRVGKLWKNREYKYRKLLFELGPSITEQSHMAYEHNVNMIVGLIYWKEYLQDIITSELHNKLILDEWVQHYTGYIRAEPLGKLVHIMAGNVPVAGVYSLVRGILTKNVNIAKLPGRDILTLLLFVLSFQDVDPDHPITRATSVLYWKREDENISSFVSGLANGMCIWGGGESIRYYRNKAPSHCEIIIYGPKNSAQIIRYDRESAPADLTFRIARDICLYEQEACLSPQVIYLQSDDPDEFIESLQKNLYLYSQIIPKGHYEIDHYVHMNYTRLCNAFAGNPSYTGESLDWMIVRVNNEMDISLEHPLGRTIYLYIMDDPRNCLKHINETVQTVAIHPLELAHSLRDELTSRGVMRITNVGGMDAPRLGVVHEGVHLTRLIKIVGMDRETTYFYKVYDLPDDYEHRFSFEKRTLKEKNLLEMQNARS